MQDVPKNDVDLNVLGTGCATSIGAGCVSFLILIPIAAAIGVQAIRQSSAVPLLGFLIGLLTDLVIGFVTARAARAHNAAVNFHVILIGAFTMLIGLLAFVLPQQNNVLSSQTQNLARFLNMVSWLITIPLMLLGASWSADDASSSGQGGNFSSY